MSKLCNIRMLVLAVTLAMISMINSQQYDNNDVGTTKEERVEIINISCDSSCSTCASVNSFYFETDDNIVTDSFAVMGKPTTMVWEGKTQIALLFLSVR